MENFKNHIQSFPDFPKKGIIFKDILPILEKPEVFNKLVKNMSSSSHVIESDALVAIDARGFLFGSSIAFHLSKPLILARKPGKLPGDIISKSYKLEYGENSLSMQTKSIDSFNSFAIIDDLLATGGTVKCVRDILVSKNKKITGLSVVVELKDLNGRSKLDFPVDAQIKF